MNLLSKIITVLIVLWGLTTIMLVILLDSETHQQIIFDLMGTMIGLSLPLLAWGIMIEVLTFMQDRHTKHHIKELERHIDLTHKLIDQQTERLNAKTQLIEDVCVAAREDNHGTAHRAARILRLLGEEVGTPQKRYCEVWEPKITQMSVK